MGVYLTPTGGFCFCDVIYYSTVLGNFPQKSQKKRGKKVFSL
jgi:hypothetical protein